MKAIPVAIVTIVIAVLLVIAGNSGNRYWFINGPRSAAITLGAIGFFLCMISVGKFITAAPAHPLSILGYLLGTIALLAWLTQIFQWKLPYIAEPKTALFVLAACIIIKTIIGRFSGLLK
jgi:hypothetical protein